MTDLILTFAVREESGPFRERFSSRPDVEIVLTGIGQKNAERAFRRALAGRLPKLVLTCGFAGALDPKLTVGTVVFAQSGPSNATIAAAQPLSLAAALVAAGARPATFHCADRVAVTAEEKRVLRRVTGADAVEMESGVIDALCREQNIASATVRVISDAADEDLPIDFNRLLDARQKLSYGRLALALAKSPVKTGALLRLQKQTRMAAEQLAEVLIRVIEGGGL